MKKIVIVLFIIFTQGCAYVEPLLQDFNLVSVAEEKQLSDQMAVEISKQMTVVQDEAALRRVRTIGERLEQALPQKEFDYQFYVIKDASPNAFTIPGARIYVHTGLLQFSGDDNELAGVIAHEIGHAYERHPAKALSRGMGADYLSQLVLKNQQGSFKAVALSLAKGGALSRYGRQDEREADEIGLYILKRAGYPPDSLRRFLTRLSSLAGRGQSIPLFASHPPTAERIARLEELERGAANMAGESRYFRPA